MRKYQDITLSRIAPNPLNPRKTFEGPAFDELTDSIREKGVIEPIIVRRLFSKEKDYEVVAGERRFRASCRLAEENNGQEHARIPAVIREMSDDEAFDFMIIENLQREDLTSAEEARSFHQYLEKKGAGTVPELAARIGKSAGYIRRMVAALSLPAYILKAWEKETLTFSHLEQLRRLKDPGELKEVFEYAAGKTFYRGTAPSKRELKEHIDKLVPALEDALFDLEECGQCNQNSDVQQRLWEIGGMKEAHCLDKKCFKQKQNNFLTKDWKHSKYRRRFGTNGFRFSENVVDRWETCNFFRDYGPTPAKKCKTCEQYLTIIHIDGSVDEGRVCFGEDNCHNSIGRQATVEKTQTERQEREESGGPRVTWHAEYFREAFLTKRLPERYQEFSHSHLNMAHMALFAFVKLDDDLLHFMAREIKFKEYYRDNKLFERIAKMELDEIQELMKKCALKVIMKHWPVTCAGRLAAAVHLGINLMKEFAVTEEYLEKKTIREMLEFGKKSKLFMAPAMTRYLQDNIKSKRFDKCKKTELIECFLKSGVNLVGKVPEEIVPSKEK